MQDLVKIGKQKINGKIQQVVSSRQVAHKFNKRHDDVLKKIRNLDCSDDFIARNFAVSMDGYKDNSGKKNNFYIMTRTVSHF